LNQRVGTAVMGWTYKHLYLP